MATPGGRDLFGSRCGVFAYGRNRLAATRWSQQARRNTAGRHLLAGSCQRVARAAQPTEPSIWSSISRLHSTAYSIGNVLVTGSMNPFTIIPMACDSERPLLMR